MIRFVLLAVWSILALAPAASFARDAAFLPPADSVQANASASEAPAREAVPPALAVAPAGVPAPAAQPVAAPEPSKEIMPMNFGVLRVGADRAVRMTMVVNDTTGPITIRSISVIDAANGLQRLGQGCVVGKPLTPGASCPVMLQWEPKAPGRISTDLVIHHSGKTAVTVIPVRGEAIAAQAAAPEAKPGTQPAPQETKPVPQEKEKPVPPPVVQEKPVALQPLPEQAKPAPQPVPEAAKLPLSEALPQPVRHSAPMPIIPEAKPVQPEAKPLQEEAKPELPPVQFEAKQVERDLKPVPPDVKKKAAKPAPVPAPRKAEAAKAKTAVDHSEALAGLNLIGTVGDRAIFQTPTGETFVVPSGENIQLKNCVAKLVSVAPYSAEIGLEGETKTVLLRAAASNNVVAKPVKVENKANRAKAKKSRR